MNNLSNQGQVDDSQLIQQPNDTAAHQDEANEMGFNDEGKKEESDVKEQDFLMVGDVNFDNGEEIRG